MAAIRFIRNINVQVEFDGEKTMVPFTAGDIFNARRIEVDAEGYNDVYMPDGSIIRGLASEIFENMGKKVPVTQVEEVETVVENEEIEVVEPEIEPALLDGTMLSDSEEPTDAEPELSSTEDGGYWG